MIGIRVPLDSQFYKYFEICPYCGSRNKSGLGQCPHCNGPLAKAQLIQEEIEKKLVKPTRVVRVDDLFDKKFYLYLEGEEQPRISRINYEEIRTWFMVCNGWNDSKFRNEIIRKLIHDWGVEPEILDQIKEWSDGVSSGSFAT